jgi:hypothetical protein
MLSVLLSFNIRITLLSPATIDVTTIICHGLVCIADVLGGCTEDPFFRFPISARATPSLQGSLRGRDHPFCDPDLFDSPPSSVPPRVWYVSICLAVACCYLLRGLSLLELHASSAQISRAGANVQLASTGKAQEVKQNAPRAPKGGRPSLHFLSMSFPVILETNPLTIAGTSRNHLRLPLLQPRELGRRQTR